MISHLPFNYRVPTRCQILTPAKTRHTYAPYPSHTGIPVPHHQTIHRSLLRSCVAMRVCMCACFCSTLRRLLTWTEQSCLLAPSPGVHGRVPRHCEGHQIQRSFARSADHAHSSATRGRRCACNFCFFFIVFFFNLPLFFLSRTTTTSHPAYRLEYW